MFVNIIHFPPIKPDKDAEFREWFAWSNQEYARHPGFISRKLLRPREAATMQPLSSTRATKHSGNAHQPDSSRSCQASEAFVRWRPYSTVL